MGLNVGSTFTLNSLIITYRRRLRPTIEAFFEHINDHHYKLSSSLDSNHHLDSHRCAHSLNPTSPMLLRVLVAAVGAAYAISVPRAVDGSDPLPEPAGLPVANPTESFWINSPGANPLASEGSTGALTSDAEVCIIGSGITGASAAYHLASAVERGAIRGAHGADPVRAVVLEARDFCAFLYCLVFMFI